MALTKKDKIQAAILFGMIIIFIFLAKGAINKSQERRRHQKEVKERLAPKADVFTPEVNPQPIAPAVQQQSTRSGGIDPFFGKTVNIGTAQSSATNLRLTGIAYNVKDPKNSYAIINNEILKIGDAVSSSKTAVKDIKEDEVTLSNGSQEIKLRVW